MRACAGQVCDALRGCVEGQVCVARQVCDALWVCAEGALSREDEIGIICGGAALDEVAGVQVDEVPAKGAALAAYPGGSVGKPPLHILSVHISSGCYAYFYLTRKAHIISKVKKKKGLYFAD